MLRTLFKLADITEVEKTHHLASGISVEDFIISTEHWATNREQIWRALDVLETRTELTVYLSHLAFTPGLLASTGTVPQFGRLLTPSGSFRCPKPR